MNLNDISMVEMNQNSFCGYIQNESVLTKDSGLGTTQGTIYSASNSSSNQTSPEDGRTRLLKKILTSTPTSLKTRLIQQSDNEETDDHQVNKTRKRQRRMHQCEFCDKQFDRPSLLKRHTLTHTGERPFDCSYCGKGFSTRSGVNTHERTHTGQRPYVCDICGRRFAAGSNLIFHKYTHSNVRKHTCSQCPKAFLTPGDLKKHEYSHNNQWPFRCSTCDRGFATERYLNAHESTHTGRKPYSCTQCGKSYAQESSLKTHLKTHVDEGSSSSNLHQNTSFMISNLIGQDVVDSQTNSDQKSESSLPSIDSTHSFINQTIMRNSTTTNNNSTSSFFEVYRRMMDLYALKEQKSQAMVSFEQMCPISQSMPNMLHNFNFSQSMSQSLNQSTENHFHVMSNSTIR